MSLAQYEIYRSKCMALARSMVIKCSPAATAMNDELERRGITVNLADPASWKYYLNLQGEYHAVDPTMYVTSLDTLQRIEFNKANLDQHQITRREYAPGSQYYETLVAEYPHLEILIQGILNPVDFDTALKAEDGTILYHDPLLVEQGETNLIPMLSEWSQLWWRRWYVPSYAFPDDLYTATMFAKLVMLMPAMIETYRLRNCFTFYAHTFHIKQHLSSNGRLDSYVDYLTRKQMLWLYRNVIYLHRNIGKQETFRELVQNVMTDRAMPLSEWDMFHDTTLQSEEIYPRVEFVRKPVNSVGTAIGNDTRDIPRMLDEEQPLARNNITVQPQAEVRIQEQMENSIRNQLKTKILESSITDLSDSTPFTKEDTLLNQWLYWADTNQYQSVVGLDNPKAGGTMTLDVLEAFYVFLYAYNLSMGIRLPNIPPLQAQMVRKQPIPTRDELYRLVDQRYLNHAVVDAIQSHSDVDGTYISIPAFHDAAMDIFRAKNAQRDIYSSVEHYQGRGQAEGVMHHMYHDVPVLYNVGMDYELWFRDLGLDVPTYSDLEAGLLATQIFTTVTGLNLVTSQSLRDIQAAMLRLMSQMSSYTVQYLQSINTNRIKSIDWPMIRAGEMDRLARKDERALTIPGTVLKIDEYRRHRLDLDLSIAGPGLERLVRWFSAQDYCIDLDIDFEGHGVRHQSIGQGAPEILNVVRQVPVLGVDTPVVNTDQYVPNGQVGLTNAFMQLDDPRYRLDNDDRETIDQRYQDYVDTHGPFKEPVQDVLPLRNLVSLWPYVTGPEP